MLPKLIKTNPANTEIIPHVHAHDFAGETAPQSCARIR